MTCDLPGLATVGFHLPYLVAAASAGHEIDESPVVRVTRNAVGSGIVCEPFRCSTVGTHAVHLELAFFIGIEDDPLAVRRPARAAGNRRAEVSRSEEHTSELQSHL